MASKVRHYWTTGLVTDDSMADQIIGQYETMKAQSDAPVFLTPSPCRTIPIIIRITTPMTSG